MVIVSPGVMLVDYAIFTVKMLFVLYIEAIKHCVPIPLYTIIMLIGTATSSV